MTFKSFELPFSSKPAQVFPNDGTHDENGQFKDTEDKPVLRGRGPLSFSLVGVERSLKGHADGRAEVCDGENKNCQLLPAIEV